MYDTYPVANGTRTDHPIPGLPFVNDGHLPLDNPTAIENMGRHRGEGLWGRTDHINGSWIALTTEPQNPDFAWAVFHHLDHGRTVLLIDDDDLAGLHSYWRSHHESLLHRHGGYWWDGECWYRPAQVWDSAYARHDRRPVDEATTLTAADVLRAGGTPENADILTITCFSVQDALPNWVDHLALWARSHAEDEQARPLDTCVVDLDAPELSDERLIDIARLATLASMSLDELTEHRRHGPDALPEAQSTADGIKRWSMPVARDWAEKYEREHGPQALLSTVAVHGTTQPNGLVADHNRLRRTFHETLTKSGLGRSNMHPAPYMEGELAQQAANDLAWEAAAGLMYGADQGLVPRWALQEVLVDAIVGGLTGDAARSARRATEEVVLCDMPRKQVELLTWYIEHQPGRATGIFGDICRTARTALDLHPTKVGQWIRKSLHRHSALDDDTIDALLRMTLPPSASA